MTKMKEKTAGLTTWRMESPVARGSAAFSSECWFLTAAAGLMTRWPAAMKKRRRRK